MSFSTYNMKMAFRESRDAILEDIKKVRKDLDLYPEMRTFLEKRLAYLQGCLDTNETILEWLEI